MKCPVCGNNTFNDFDYEYDICNECFWEYDLIQVENPDYSGGANRYSLNDYRKIYQRLKQEKPDFSCKNDKDRNRMITFDSEEYFKYL